MPQRYDGDVLIFEPVDPLKAQNHCLCWFGTVLGSRSKRKEERTMESRQNYHVCSLVIAAVIALPLTASANDGTPPWIFELVQQGDGVAITLAIVSGGEPGFGESYTLTRTDPEGSTAVFEERQFTNDDIEESRIECRGGGTGDELCQTEPENCTDCDGDGVPESALTHV
jgi:hypothetical protein